MKNTVIFLTATALVIFASYGQDTEIVSASMPMIIAKPEERPKEDHGPMCAVLPTSLDPFHRWPMGKIETFNFTAKIEIPKEALNHLPDFENTDLQMVCAV